MYAPYLNQFIQPDTIVPDPYQPMDWNKYLYVRDNPINFTDPSGHCSGNPQDQFNPDIACWRTLERIQANYVSLTIDSKNWTNDELLIFEDALGGILHVFGGNSTTFSTAIGNWTVKRRHWGLSLWTCGIGCTFYPTRSITLYDGIFSGDSGVAKFDIVHEFGHAFDANENINTPKSLGEFRDKFWPGCFRFFTKGLPFGPNFEGIQGSPASERAKVNSSEDFAETFAVYVWMQNDWGFESDIWRSVTIPDNDRLQYMEDLIATYNSAR